MIARAMEFGKSNNIFGRSELIIFPQNIMSDFDIDAILERVGLHTCNKDQVKECERLSEEEIHAMCTRATEIFVKESNILIMHSPITVKASRSL